MAAKFTVLSAKEVQAIEKNRIVPVLADEPTGEGVTKHEFKAEFKVIETKSWGEMTENYNVRECLEKTLVDITEVEDFVYSPDRFDDFVAQAWLLSALWESCLAVQNSVSSAKLREIARKRRTIKN
jgi:hypothetical protein